MTKYELVNGIAGDFLIAIFDDGRTSFVPIDETNSDYQAYLKSLEDSE
jgi:hypothetical protein